MIYWFKRVAILTLTLFGISLVAFFLIRLIPGDPVLHLLGERGASPEVIAEMRSRLGFDAPLPVQYVKFISQVLKGDLGVSILSGQPVWEEFLARFPATLELGLIALLWATVLGIPIGVVAAVKKQGFWDYFISTTSLIGYSMPIFWWALILILIFSVHLGLTPVSGRIDVAYDIPSVTGFMLIDSWQAGWPAFLSSLSHLILPAFALGTIPLAVIVRMTRSSVLEVLGEDYIRTARAKGIGYSRIVSVHALRNALIPVLTILGLLAGTLVTGAVLTETIFSWPGIGKWLVHSVLARDYPVIQGGLLLISFMVILINLFVDLLYVVVNPRLRT